MRTLADGAPAAIARTQDEMPDPMARRAALAAAADALVSLRRYPEAAALLTEAANGSDQATALLARADLLAKIHPFDPARLSSKDPHDILVLVLAKLTGSGQEGNGILGMLAEAQKSEANLDAFLRFWTLASRQALAKGGTQQNMMDFLASTAKVTLDGDDARGYRVRLQNGSSTLEFLVTKERGEYKLVDLAARLDPAHGRQSHRAGRGFRTEGRFGGGPPDLGQAAHPCCGPGGAREAEGRGRNPGQGHGPGGHVECADGGLVRPGPDRGTGRGGGDGQGLLQADWG
jgi:hypothetical protein